MKTINNSLSIALALVVVFILTGCDTQKSEKVGTMPVRQTEIKADQLANSNVSAAKYKVTFIELGSVRCIPCKQMQPIMKSIKEKYTDQVNVVFYDVWTEPGAPFAKQYNIEAIPTQVFLDKDGKEYFRHVGFFPEEELVKILQQKGVK